MPWQPIELMNQRLEFVLKALQKDNFRALCREYGVSPKIGYKWLERFKEDGARGLGDRSRRPKSSPDKLEQDIVCRIIRLKQRHPHWGPRKLQAVYARSWGEKNLPSESSFKRVLESCGMVHKRRVQAEGKGAIRASGRRGQAPNEVWTVDFKGWWHDAQGRCNPLTVRDESSRYVLELRALADARTQTVQACFERLFARHGVPGAIRSDNGPPFASSHGLLGLSRLSAWWLAQGIVLERGRPGCPQDNGGHERMHLDIARELEAAAYEERQGALDVWRRQFNEERPHEALGMRRPAEVYRSKTTSWVEVQELAYTGAQKRRVQARGTIQYEGRSIFLSKALAGWDVGLRKGQDESVNVYFATTLLGQLEAQTEAFLAAGVRNEEKAGEEEAG